MRQQALEPPTNVLEQLRLFERRRWRCRDVNGLSMLLVCHKKQFQRASHRIKEQRRALFGNVGSMYHGKIQLFLKRPDMQRKLQTSPVLGHKETHCPVDDVDGLCMPRQRYACSQQAVHDTNRAETFRRQTLEWICRQKNTRQDEGRYARHHALLGLLLLCIVLQAERLGHVGKCANLTKLMQFFL